MSISDLKGPLEKVQATMNGVYRFVGVTPHELDSHHTTAKNQRKYAPMSAGIRSRLEKFYEPFNQRLHTLLEQHGIN